MPAKKNTETPVKPTKKTVIFKQTEGSKPVEKQEKNKT